MNEPWRTLAACKGRPSEWWFPADTAGGHGRDPAVAPPTRDAIAVCRVCPVQVQCLAYAQAAGASLHGIWGGLTSAQRARKRNGRQPWRKA